MQSRFSSVAPEVLLWADTCDAWVIRDGAAAMLFDLGDGGVLDALHAIAGNKKLNETRRAECRQFL